MPSAKSKNKRFVRRHVLNVKMRTSQRRHLLARRAAWTVAISLLAVLAVCVTWHGGHAIMRWAVTDNPHFAIERVTVENDGLIRNDQMVQWAGIRRGLNLFSLDLNRVRRDLELLPILATAEVERVLPDTIRIRVHEREAVARYAPAPAEGLEDGRHTLYTVDREGYVMAPLLPHQLRVPQSYRLDHLPLLHGLPRQDIRPGYQVESPQVRAALDLIDTFSASSMASLADLRVIDVSRPGVLVIRTSQEAQVTFGLSGFAQQIARWRTAEDLSRRSGQRLESLDLSVTNNVPFRWQRAGSHEPASPTAPSV